MGNQIEGLELVSSEHVRFLLRHLAPAATPVSQDELVEHTTAADLATPLQAVARSFGMLRIESVASDGDRIIVHADHENERRPREWAFTINVDGRVATVSAGPMVEGVEFTIGSPKDLSQAEQDDLQRVFAAAYTDPDRDYLDRQFSTMKIVTMARRAQIERSASSYLVASESPPTRWERSVCCFRVLSASTRENTGPALRSGWGSVRRGGTAASSGTSRPLQAVSPLLRAWRWP